MGILGSPLGFPLGGEEVNTAAPDSRSGEVWAEQLRFAWNGTTGRRILKSFASLLIDKAIDWGTAGVTLRFPRRPNGDPTELGALQLLGRERQIERGPSESTDSYALRLEAAPAQWKAGGTPLGLLVQLYYTGFSGAVIVQQNGLGWTLNSAPVLSDLGGALPSWVDRVTLGPNPPIPASTDGKPAIPAGTVPWFTFDSGMDAAGNQYNSRFGILFPSTAPDPLLGTAANLARLSRIVAAWKPAKAKCMGAVVYGSGAMWGWPTTLVWGGFAWGGTVTAYAV